MNVFKLMILVLVAVSHSSMATASTQTHPVGTTVTMSAEGYQAITTAHILLPVHSTVRSAAKKAKKNLVNKCASEHNGEIQGEIQLETLRFDEGCMCAIVLATGVCQIDAQSQQ